MKSKTDKTIEMICIVAALTILAIVGGTEIINSISPVQRENAVPKDVIVP
jgi:hypothetical protein